MDLMFWHSLRVHPIRGPHTRGSDLAVPLGAPVGPRRRGPLWRKFCSVQVLGVSLGPPGERQCTTACLSRPRGRSPPSPGAEGMTEVVSVFWILSGER